MPDHCPLAYNWGFIKPLGGETIRFQFLPEDISDSKAANYNETEILSRSMPLMGYASSSARQLSFSLQFYRTDTFDPYEVANKIRSLEYANYQGGDTGPPPVCLVQVGEVRIKGVLMQCEITHKHPWDVKEKKPMYVEISVTFSETNETPWSYMDVWKGLDQQVSI